MTYPTDEWPTQPVVWRNEMPRCVGACHQGRIPCQHPMLCSCTTLSDLEFDDASAELTTDRAPLTSGTTAAGEPAAVFGQFGTDLDGMAKGEATVLLILLLVAMVAWLAAVANLVMLIGGAV